jgi:diketogulonate reductase-like aldo/keto reductase
MIIDTAPLHNQLTEDTISSERTWRKELIIRWFISHNVIVPVKATKPELIELAFNNLPKKRYVIDEIAKENDVDITRFVRTHTK